MLYCNWITGIYLNNSVPTHNSVLKLKTYKTFFPSFTRKQSYIIIKHNIKMNSTVSSDVILHQTTPP